MEKVGSSTEWTAEQKSRLRDVLVTIEAFRSLDPEMQAQQMATLLQVALNEGTSLREIMAKTGSSSSAVTRHIYAFSEWKARNIPGLNFVKAETDPDDRRRSSLFLTSKGRVFLSKLIDAIR